MKYYLAIDIGASSGRHILAHIENGKMITEEIYRFQNGPETLKAYDGKEHLMWTHERLFGEILNGLKKAKEMGLVSGFLIGSIYTLLAFLVFFILNGGMTFDISLLNDTIFGGIAGGISGVVAVNFKKK